MGGGVAVSLQGWNGRLRMSNYTQMMDLHHPTQKKKTVPCLDVDGDVLHRLRARCARVLLQRREALGLHALVRAGVRREVEDGLQGLGFGWMFGGWVGTL